MSPIAILCNGPSLADHAAAGNLKRIPCETIGLNHSWELARSSYHVMIDPKQWEDFKRVTGKPINATDVPNLYTGTGADRPAYATHLNVMDTVEPRFSFDATTGVWLCGAVTWVALQLAVSLKKHPIYFFGLDLKPRGTKGKFYGGTWDRIAEPRQRELFGYAQALLVVMMGFDLYNVVINPNDTNCHAFRKVTFDQAFPEANDVEL